MLRFKLPNDLDTRDFCLTNLIWIPVVQAIRQFRGKHWSNPMSDEEKEMDLLSLEKTKAKEEPPRNPTEKEQDAERATEILKRFSL